jgi:hypothetical protein
MSIDNLGTDAIDEDVSLPGNKPPQEYEEDLIKKIYRDRKQADTAQGKWREEARLDYAFLAGDQWTDDEKTKFEELFRVPVVFNRIERTIESVRGHEVNNRQAVKYLPRQSVQDAAPNELLTNAADWVRDQCDAEDEESDSFGDMLTCGVGWVETKLDYEENPDGNVLIERVDPLLMRWDPSARKRNLVDMRWVQHDRKMKLADIRNEWPDKKDELTGQSLDAPSIDDEVDEPHHAEQAWKYTDNQFAQEGLTERTVICHQWIEMREFYRVLDPASGQIIEIDAQGLARIEAAIAQGIAAPMQSQPVKMKKRVYQVAYACGSVVLDSYESLVQNGFTFACMTGRRDRNKNTWYGLVRPMRDPQKFANKYLSQIESLLRSNSKGGLLVEEGATDDIRKLETDWARQDSVIQVNDGALSGGKIQPKQVQSLPQGPEKLLDFSVNSIDNVSGVNLESLGLVDRNQPGILEVQRKEAALVILAPMFSSLRRYRKVQGRVLAEFIVKYISDGRLIRITSGDGTEQSIPLLRMPETLEYDVVVDSSSNAPDQKNKTFTVLAALIPAMQSSGFPVPSEVLDYSPLPQSLITKWKQQIQEQQAKGPPKSPELQKAELMAHADLLKAQLKDKLDRENAVRSANLEVFKATIAAQTKAQVEQMYAAINEQSQIINARANEQKAFGDAINARLEGLAKIVDATAKMRAHAEKAIASANDRAAPKAPNIIALPMSDNGANELHAAAVAQMSQAVQALTTSLSRPRTVLRDAQGNIRGVQ